MPPQIPELRNLSDLSLWLGVPKREITWWIWGIRPGKRYTEFEIAKRREGETRLIRAPIKPIKDMQRTVAAMLLSAQEQNQHSHGYVAGRSTITGAAVHQSQRWLLSLDLQDFFPSINFGRVRGVFGAHPFDFPPEVATILAQLCCYENQLPQGAPTSPALSNLVCRQLDKEIGRLAANSRCHYTRYADDIAISTSQRDFPESIASQGPEQVVLGENLVRAIRSNGFEINNAKTRLVPNSFRHRVTGIVVNESPNVPRERIRSLRNLLYIWEKYGEVAAAEAYARQPYHRNLNPGVQEVSWKETVRGRLQYIGYVRGWADPVYDRLASRLDALDDGFSRKPRLEGELRRIVLYPEGESDAILIQAALKHFHSRGEFTNLVFELDPEFRPNGDSVVWKMCDLLSAAQQTVSRVGLFDNDSEGFVKKTFRSAPVRYLRNGVGLVLLAPPHDGFGQDRYCIESLFESAPLNWFDEDGRRLYFSWEFDPETGRHLAEDLRAIGSVKRTLVAERVENSSGKNVALGKVDFAELVANGSGDFSDANLAVFGPTLARFEAISLNTELSVRGMNW